MMRLPTSAGAVLGSASTALGRWLLWLAGAVRLPTRRGQGGNRGDLMVARTSSEAGVRQQL
jgi:cation transporter-like permease